MDQLFERQPSSAGYIGYRYWWGAGVHLGAIKAAFGSETLVLVEPDNAMSDEATRIASVEAWPTMIIRQPLELLDVNSLGSFSMVMSSMVAGFVKSPTAYLRTLAGLCTIGGYLSLQEFVVPSEYPELEAWLFREGVLRLTRAAYRPWPEYMLEEFLGDLGLTVIARDRNVLPAEKQTQQQMLKWRVTVEAIRDEVGLLQASTPDLNVNHYLLQKRCSYTVLGK